MLQLHNLVCVRIHKHAYSAYLEAVHQTHLHEQQSCDEGAALTVAHLPVIDGVGLEYVQQTFLTKAIALLEERMLWERSVEVTLDGTHKRRLLLQGSRENYSMHMHCTQ